MSETERETNCLRGEHGRERKCMEELEFSTIHTACIEDEAYVMECLRSFDNPGELLKWSHAVPLHWLFNVQALCPPPNPRACIHT